MATNPQSLDAIQNSASSDLCKLLSLAEYKASPKRVRLRETEDGCMLLRGFLPPLSSGLL